MDTMNYSEFRMHLASALDNVNIAHRPLLVTRQNGKPAVVMSLEDFNSYEETAYLMASPKNAARLDQSIKQLQKGKGISHDLIEDDE